MVDCHIHIILDGVNWKTAIARHSTNVCREWVRSVLSAYRDAGFTWLRDGGDRWGVGAFARSIAPEYGITYRTPLSPLCMAGHYGSFIGTEFSNLQEYTALVRRQKRLGADFVKIMISGLMDFSCRGRLTEDGLAPELIAQLVHIAHGEGMAVMAHANGSANVTAAAQAGVDSVEHGAYLSTQALQAMAQAGTVWVPTLSTVCNLRGKGRFPEGEVSAIAALAVDNVTAFAAMGGMLAPGTDAGAWAVPHAITTEYALLAGIDLTPGIQTIQAKF